jgi:hypothetical protein
MMATTTRRSWAQVVIQAAGAEVWACGRALNQRPPLTVLRVGRTRYRADRRVRTSAAELRADGWVLEEGGKREG